MACNCNNNILRSKVGTVALNTGSTAVVLTPDNAIAPANENRIEIIVTSSVPAAGMALPVNIVLNGADVPVYDRFGNIVYGSNIRTRFVIRGYYGTNGAGGTAHFQLVNLPIGRVCS